MQNCVIWLDIRSDRADSDVLRAVLYLIVIGGTAQSKNPLFFYFEKKTGLKSYTYGTKKTLEACASIFGGDNT